MEGGGDEDAHASAHDLVEILLDGTKRRFHFGNALAEGERALKLRGAHTGGRNQNDKDDSKNHAFKKAVSSARTSTAAS